MSTAPVILEPGIGKKGMRDLTEVDKSTIVSMYQNHIAVKDIVAKYRLKNGSMIVDLVRAAGSDIHPENRKTYHPGSRGPKPEAPLTKQAVEEEIHEAELRLANLKAKRAAMAIRVEVTGDGIIEVHGASPSFTKLGGMARFRKVLEQSFGPQERLEGQSHRELAVNLAMVIFHVTKEEVLDMTSDLEKIEEALNRFM